MECNQLNLNHTSSHIPRNGLSNQKTADTSPTQFSPSVQAKNGLPSNCANAISVVSRPDCEETQTSGTRAHSPVGKPVRSRDAKSLDSKSIEGQMSGKSSGINSSASPNSPSDGNSGISPASVSNGNRSTHFSTSDSIFTYSLTDESQDELDSGLANPVRRDAKTISDATCDNETAEAADDKTNVVAPCDQGYFDRSAVIKYVIDKVYVHNITYTVSDLKYLEKNANGSQNERKTNETSGNERTLPSSKKLNASSLDKELGRKKFSARSIKHFLKSMSPSVQHRKALKSSESFDSRSSSTLADSADNLSLASEDACESGVKRSPAIGKDSPLIGHASSSHKHSSPIAATFNSNRSFSDSPAVSRSREK